MTPAVGNYVLTSASQLGNYVIADSSARNAGEPGGPGSRAFKSVDCGRHVEATSSEVRPQAGRLERARRTLSPCLQIRAGCRIPSLTWECSHGESARIGSCRFLLWSGLVVSPGRAD